MAFGSDLRGSGLLPTTVSLAVEIVRIDVYACGKIVLHEIDRRFRFDPDFVPARTAGRVLRCFAHPAHCATTRHSKDARQQESQSQSLHRSILPVQALSGCC